MELAPTSPGGPFLAEAGPSAAAPAVDQAPGSAPGWIDRHASDLAARASQARLASGRRRRVDPTTCERDYSAAELEFMRAMQEYKARSGRMFPTWSEVLEVLKGLGYTKDEGPEPGHAG